jgi:hypothetical protein
LTIDTEAGTDSNNRTSLPQAAGNEFGSNAERRALIVRALYWA